MTRKFKGHIIMLERETVNGTEAIRYEITSATGLGAAVGHSGWFYELKSLANAARECERIINNAIAGDEATLAGQAVL